MTATSKRWLRGVLYVLLAAVILFLMGFCLLAWLFSGFGGQVTKVLGPEETTQQVTQRLFAWELCERESYHKTEYRTDGSVASVTQLTRPIEGLRGTRGFTESGGFNGDGDDFYEASASTQLIAAIKAKVASLQFKRVLDVSSKEGSNGLHAPDWWPTKWPPNAECHETRFDLMVLDPSGGRIWIHISRM